MSYEYILTFENDTDLSHFIENVSSSSLFLENSKNIDLRAPNSSSQWGYDVRLVELDLHRCLIQVATKSEAIFKLFDSILQGGNFQLTEDGDEDSISLEEALMPRKLHY